MNMLKMNPLLHVLLIGTLLNPTAGAAETSNTVLKGPVKVFLMAGQSNMEGHAMVHTFDYIGDDPATAPLLKKMRNPDGTPKVCDHVWISYFTGLKGINGEGFGKLTTGYGSRKEWLADLIRDVRKDLNAPQMPFVIGVMGIDGPQVGRRNFFREAMAAPACYPEFKGNVVAVQTTPFWDVPLGEIFTKQVKANDFKHRLEIQVKNGKLTKDEADKQAKEFREKLITPEETKMWERGASNGSVHYLGCAKTFALMGQAFANAILEIPKS